MPGGEPSAPAAIRLPRRLSRPERREQLVAAAMPIAAVQGLTDFSLDDIAAHAGVTRNLLYHYFPRGRQDVALAVLERAGRELAGGWVVDEALPLQERLAVNVQRMIDHALGPTDAWRIYRLARATTDDEMAAITRRFLDIVVSAIALNQFGTATPQRLQRTVLFGYVGFFEAVLDEARTQHIPRDRLLRMLSEALVAVVAAANGASDSR
jgi:AcrR family transcriptional regulator